ncbi:MAG: hypothetical protein ABI867_09735 [Kofleriaceae bacterium]
MTVAVLLAVLALFDAMLGGFRAAAGRDGRIDKRVYFRAAMVRAAVLGIVVIAANAAIAAALVATAGDPAATWREVVHAGAWCVWIFGGFATVTVAALGFWFVPIAEYRLLASIIVLGPLTLVRPIVIVAGLVIAATRTSEPRVWILAAIAGVSMLGFEHVLGRAHATRWRRLVASGQ